MCKFVFIYKLACFETSKTGPSYCYYMKYTVYVMEVTEHTKNFFLLLILIK